jgi:ferrous iron transport protein A
MNGRELASRDRSGGEWKWERFSYTLAFMNSTHYAGTSGCEVRLADLATGTVARVVSVSSGEGAAPLEMGRRLAELGFLPGEPVRIVARGLLSRAPLAVRVGTGTFALRLFEAACIRVCPEQPPPGV